MLFLSIHPEFVLAIVEGKKTVELRKRRPSAELGSIVAIYATTPRCEVVATATLSRVDFDAPEVLWRRVRNSASVTKAQYDSYYMNSDLAVGLHLDNVLVLNRPILLAELRSEWKQFQPPQQFRYLDSNQQRLIQSQSSTPGLALRG